MKTMMVEKQISDDVILVRRDRDLMWRKIVIKIAEKVFICIRLLSIVNIPKINLKR